MHGLINSLENFVSGGNIREMIKSNFAYSPWLATTVSTPVYTFEIPFNNPASSHNPCVS